LLEHNLYYLSLVISLLESELKTITSMQEAKYRLAGRLKLQGEILCLRATDDGKLASGGDGLLNNLELAAELI
jgi:hypothetical protein